MKQVVLIFGLLFFNVITASGQDGVVVERQPKCDTIPERKFNRMVKEKYKLIKRGYDTNVTEMISLVRVYNTLQFERNYHHTSKYRSLFKSKFKEVYIDKAVALLECKPSQGNWYSKKYDLFITSGYRMKCDNYFFIK